MRFQSPIKNRRKLYSGVHPKIQSGVEDLAYEYECSKSFVVNTLLADIMKIKIDERFDDIEMKNHKLKNRSNLRRIK